MRLIDADKVVTIQVYDDMTEKYGTKKVTIADAIDEWSDEGCPETIDAEPIKYGHWIECESENGIHIHKCSECGKRDMYKGAFKDFNGRGFSFYYKRQCCPYCGAKMDLDEVKE